MKLLLSCKRKINKDKNGEVVSHLEILEVVLIHSNIANNDYQQDSRVFYTFVPNKSLDQFLDISWARLLCQSFYVSPYGLLIKNLNP